MFGGNSERWGGKGAGAALLAVVVCMFGNGVRGQEKKDNVMEKIRKAWEEREKKCRSVHVEWTETKIIPVGWHSDMWTLDREGGRVHDGKPNNNPVPPTQSTLVTLSTLAVNDDHIHITQSGWQWDNKKQRYTLMRVESRCCANHAAETREFSSEVF